MINILDLFRLKKKKKQIHYITCRYCGFERTSDHSPKSDFHNIKVSGKLSPDRCPKCNCCGGYVGPYSLKKNNNRKIKK